MQTRYTSFDEETRSWGWPSVCHHIPW